MGWALMIEGRQWEAAREAKKKFLVQVQVID